MSTLSFSAPQAGQLARRTLARQQRDQAQRVDAQLAAAPVADVPADLARLQALRELLLADLPRQAGAAAPFVAVDLQHTADAYAAALALGAAYRESRAAALMLGAAALGAMWLCDERLLPASAQALPDGSIPPCLEDEPEDDAARLAWAQSSWARHHAAAAAALEDQRVPVAYALQQARDAGFDAESVRRVAAAAFPADEPESAAPSGALRRFLARERQQLDAVLGGLEPAARAPLDRLCIAADLAHGLGRFARLARQARTTPGLDGKALQRHLLGAFDALADPAA